MGNRDEWKRLRQQLERQGLDVVLARSGHYKVYKGKQFLTVMSCSPSDHRSLRNKLSELRKRGVEV